MQAAREQRFRRCAEQNPVDLARVLKGQNGDPLRQSENYVEAWK